MKTLIQIDNLNKKYKSKELFSDASLHILADQRIGCIGRNGAGKSTLCKMLIEQEEPDSGSILKHSELRLGYLEQKDPFKQNERPIDFLLRHTKKPEWQCRKVAHQFQLSDEQLDGQVSNLSGGYQTRIKCTAMMLQEPNFLILDEPTNYLDLSTLFLLEKFLKEEFRGGYIIVSHDREFLNKTCDYILEVAHGKLTFFEGNIDQFLVYREDQKRYVENHNRNVEQKRRHLQGFVDRFKSKSSKARQAQSKIKQIKQLEELQEMPVDKNIIINLPQIEKRRGAALQCKELTIGYPEKTVAKKINFFIPHGSHVAILGDNGQGKTTFVKTIADNLRPLSGSYLWGNQVQLGYYAQHVYAEISEEHTVYTYLREMAAQEYKDQAIYDMAGNFLFAGADIDKPVKVLSGGERARLCLAGLLLHKYDVILLDEPTNHLDFDTVEALARALNQYAGTLFVISHDRSFIRQIASDVIQVGDGKVRRYEGTYDEYLFALRNEIKEHEADFVSIKPKAEEAQEKREPKHIRLEIRELEKLLKRKEREKQKLDEDFARGMGTFDKDKARQYKSVSVEIEEIESKWLELQDELEQ